MARAKKRTSKKRKRTPKKRTSQRKRSAPDIDAREKGILQAEPPRDRDLAKLDASFRERLTAALADLETRGTPFRFVEGFRTVERQQWLFGSGRRTFCLSVAPVRSSPIVTA